MLPSSWRIISTRSPLFNADSMAAMSFSLSLCRISPPFKVATLSAVAIRFFRSALSSGSLLYLYRLMHHWMHKVCGQRISLCTVAFTYPGLPVSSVEVRLHGVKRLIPPAQTIPLSSQLRNIHRFTGQRIGLRPATI